MILLQFYFLYLEGPLTLRVTRANSIYCTFCSLLPSSLGRDCSEQARDNAPSVPGCHSGQHCSSLLLLTRRCACGKSRDQSSHRDQKSSHRDQNNFQPKQKSSINTQHLESWYPMKSYVNILAKTEIIDQHPASGILVPYEIICQHMISQFDI